MTMLLKRKVSQSQSLSQSQSPSPRRKILPLWKGLTYFDHQLTAIYKMLELEQIGTKYKALTEEDSEGTVYGGFQCDDMGLGKTIQILATIKNNRKLKTLIVCPLALIDNWTENALKAGFRVFIKDAYGWIECESEEFCEGPDVYVTNYDTILYRYAMLNEGFDRIVLDEAHSIRSYKSKKTELILKLAEDVKIKWSVTGTPIVNSYKDAMTLFAFQGVPTLPSMTWIPTYYQPLVNEMVIHRSMEEMRAILPSCPPKPIIEKRIVPFKDEREEAFYSELQGLKSDYEFAYKVGDNETVLTTLLRLKQSSVMPHLVDKTWDTSSSKMDALKAEIDAQPDQKFIVFCSFIEEMEILAEFLDTTCELYHGGLNVRERRDVLARANEEDCQVLLLQLQCGGCGLNLQKFTRIAFMSPWWTSALMDQAIARAVRMGQKETVKVYHFLLKVEEGTNIDAMANAAAEAKRGMLIKFFENRCLLPEIDE
jgi:SNF2 family DNA or RNA helicase